MTKLMEKLNGASVFALAQRAGADRMSITKVLKGHPTANPTFETIERIVFASGGALTFEDFCSPKVKADVERRLQEYGALADAPKPGWALQDQAKRNAQ